MRSGDGRLLNMTWNGGIFTGDISVLLTMFRHGGAVSDAKLQDATPISGSIRTQTDEGPGVMDNSWENYTPA